MQEKEHVLYMLKSYPAQKRRVEFLQREIDGFSFDIDPHEVSGMALPALSESIRVQHSPTDLTPLCAAEVEKIKKDLQYKLDCLVHERNTLLHSIRRAESAVDALVMEQTSVIEQRYFRGLTIQQAAAALHMSPSTVVNTTKSAIENLCRLL